MSAWITAHLLSRTALRGAAFILVAAIAGCGGSAAGNHGGGAQPSGRAGPSGGARPGSAASFLASYVRTGGRVARPDQGGDTVSEGQAYGMLLAEVAGDRAAFQRIWHWTESHLQRGDGLFAYHADATGRVLDSQSASDADLLIAWALLRYTGPRAPVYHTAGRKVAAAVLAHEVTNGPGGMPILAAGPWATGRPASLNPSYWSIGPMRALASLTGDMRWQRLAATAEALTRQLTNGGRLLPPDWAVLTATGQVRPEPAPSGNVPQPQYGLDAQRTVVWFATACDPRARSLAAQWWPKLRGTDQSRAIALRLDGGMLNPQAAPLPLVASASAAHAARDQAASSRLLEDARQQQRSYPTYYGAAWAAFGPALLDGALAHCA